MEGSWSPGWKYAQQSSLHEAQYWLDCACFNVSTGSQYEGMNTTAG